MDRKQIISEIEKARGSKVITYIVSDRPGPAGARVAVDIIPVVNRQLMENIGHAENIDLFLYSTGGDTMVPWRLVSMIREYCKKFSVIVPYKAHSAATMIALGADEIVMSELSELSPIDPSTANIFNPAEPNNPQGRIPISTEEVIAYFDLARKVGINSSEEIKDIFAKFVEANPAVHPLALGNVYRTYNLIRILAVRLLKSHNRPIPEDDIKRVVDFLTEKLYSHQYLIGRKEAKEELGLQNVLYADDNMARLMFVLFSDYKKEMELDSSWNPEMEITKGPAKNYRVAVVETAKSQNYYEVSLELKRQELPPAPGQPAGQMPQVVWRMAGQQGWR